MHLSQISNISIGCVKAYPVETFLNLIPHTQECFLKFFM